MRQLEALLEACSTQPCLLDLVALTVTLCFPPSGLNKPTELSPEGSLATVWGMAEEVEEPPVSRQEWPEPGLLAKTWEEVGPIRKVFRDNGQLLVWPKKDLVGVASLRALGMNKTVVSEAVKVWSSKVSTAKSPPVDWLKEEARFAQE